MGFFESEIKIRVRYGETDRMGYVYYGNYAQYFEVGRVEALRELGFSYKQMEEDGIMLPVYTYNVKFVKPAFYDDELRVKTMIKDEPGARITFHFETYNQDNVLLNTAEVVLVFIDIASNKPCPPPEDFKETLAKHLL